MPKAAIIVLADTEGHEALGRVANALYAVQEFKEAGDEVKLIFDGAGVKWIGELSRSDHMYHELYQQLRDCIGGVCEYCAKAFKATEAVETEKLAYANEHAGHPSFRQMLQQGYQILTF
ncbi:MAG: DsrE family protein [Phycisphaeraceae bacterium]